MSITFSKDQAEFLKIQLDNLFVTEYMPFAPDSYVKVYLYGLSLAHSASGDKNGMDEISKKLGIDVRLVSEAFRYWESQGIVSVLDTVPSTIEYALVKPISKQLKKFKKEKYKTFNNQLHAMLPHRNFLPNEYNEYYNLIENYHIEIEAMLTIIAYCVRLKGESISYPYILAVARNLAHEGCVTYDRVQERLSELDLYDSDMGAVLKALKLKKAADYEDRRLFIKWTKTLGFGVETVVQVAKQIKKGGMDRLDALLTKYYENRLLDITEINTYNEKRDSLYSLAKEVNRIIGVYYEQLDYIIETYINKWLSYGFDEKTLLTIAEYCFKRNVRTLEGMNEFLMKLYKEGLITVESIGGFISETAEIDKRIRDIMDKAGLNRKITSWDRDYYRTWTFSWKMPDDVIAYAAELSAGKTNPLSYMNAILSGWNELDVRNADAARKLAQAPQQNKSAGEIPSASRNYTNEEINAMFDRLNPDEV